MAPSQMWNDVRIEKERVAVSITMVGGETLSGSLFAPQIYPPGGLEDPLQLLNEIEPFFPLGLSTGEVLLIAKDRVLEISLDEAQVDEELPGSAPTALLQVTLAGGTSHVGSMRLEVRAPRPRVLDYINHCTARFMALRTDEGVRLINRKMIERVRPLD
ncbi:MAG: hypothetical protein ABI884_10985 [Gemmatimonadota bacterium]